MRAGRKATAGRTRPAESEAARRLATQLSVTDVLAAGGSGAAVAVLEQVCRGLDWDLGVVWVSDAERESLACSALWQPRSRPLRPLAAAITARSLGATAAARTAFESGATVRSPARGRVEAGIAVPVSGAGRTLGVLELLARGRRPRDRELGRLVAGFGLQLGAWLALAEADEWARAVDARHRAVLDAAPDPVISIDGSGRVIEFNPAAERVFGHVRGRALGHDMVDLLFPRRLRDQQRSRLLHRLGSDRVTVLGRRHESIAVRADGGELPVEITIARAPLPGRRELTTYMRDISAGRRADRAMRNLAAIVESSDDAILSTTLDGTILTWNGGAATLYGHSAEEAIGRSIGMLAVPGAGDELAGVLDVVRRGESLARFGTVSLRRDGSSLDVELTLSPVVDGGGHVVGASVIARDVTDRKQAQAQIAHLAYHDHLTGLPNRELFYQHLELALARADRNRLGVAVLFVDLDSFKLVNDSFGHLVGDTLLRDFAARLRTVMRATDIVARQGGDEFLVLVPDLELDGGAGIEPNALAIVQSIETKVRSVLDAPFDVAGTPVHVGLSIGVSIYPLDARDRDQLLRNADTAMYVGKGREGDEVLDRAPDRSRSRLALITRLRRAVEHEQFELHYQPIVELATGRMVGVESLLRWRDPEQGLVLPEGFIPLAERSGLIEPITRWVIDNACLQARRWSDDGLDLVVTFNLPPALWGPAIVETLIEATQRAGVEPHRMMIEITESTAMAQPGRARQTLAALREHGVRLAIDDFGTGHSSLGRLHQLPVSTLKIDRSFVSALPHDPGAAAIVASIVQLAHSLGLQPLAEGIESEQQLRFLVERGCDLGQGYLLGRPMVPERIQALT